MTEIEIIESAVADLSLEELQVQPESAQISNLIQLNENIVKRVIAALQQKKSYFWIREKSKELHPQNKSLY